MKVCNTITLAVLSMLCAAQMYTAPFSVLTVFYGVLFGITFCCLCYVCHEGTK
jgi:hypothetical protein